MKGVVNLCCVFLTVVEEVVNEMGTDYSEMEINVYMLKVNIWLNKNTHYWILALLLMH